MHVLSAVKFRFQALDWPVRLPLLRKHVLDRVPAAGHRWVLVRSAEMVLDRLQIHAKTRSRVAPVRLLGAQVVPQLFVARPVR